MAILAGDIGGTSTRLALFESRGGALRAIAQRRYTSLEYAGLEAILRDFCSGQPQAVEAACVAAAGPIVADSVQVTNLPWIVDARVIAQELKLASAWLINDLEAVAWGIEVLSAADFATLNEGAPAAQGNRAVIAAGTGLGQAGSYWDGRLHYPFPCEGGHTDFAPRNELEIDLLRYLSSRFERVSCERVVSGMGLHSIYEFLRDSARAHEEPWLAQAIREGDPGAEIAQAALTDRSALALQTLELFVSLYGAEAGNLALKLNAKGGVYVGGGIAPKILGKLKQGAFMQSFLAKGRMRPIVAAMPVHVILNDTVGLLGAAYYCQRAILSA